VRPRATRTESAAEWYGATVRGLEALEFLERSSDVAAEPVSGAPLIAVDALATLRVNIEP